MHKVTVDNGLFRVGAGQLLGLSPAQVKDRRHKLDRAPDAVVPRGRGKETDGWSFWTAREAQEFRRGEVLLIAITDLTRTQQAALAVSDERIAAARAEKLEAEAAAARKAAAEKAAAEKAAAEKAAAEKAAAEKAAAEKAAA